MLTRRQAKSQGVSLLSTWEHSKKFAKGCSPEKHEEPKIKTTIDGLSDLTLVEIFSLLPVDDLVRVAQVSSRWRGLAGSRRLWSGVRLSYGASDPASCLRLVRTLRRAALPAYTSLLLRTTNGCIVAREAYFESNAATLVVVCDSSFLCLLALRELLTAHVLKLDLKDTHKLYFSDFEAFTAWELMANSPPLCHIKLELWRHSKLFSSPYRWPAVAQARISSLDFALGGSDDAARLVCRPVRDLMQASRASLVRVRIRPQDQQDLLKLCPSQVCDVLARPLPGLAVRLRRLHRLRTLRLVSIRMSGLISHARLEVLNVLALPRLKTAVTFLSLDLPAEADGEVLQAVAECRAVRNLTLYGFRLHLDGLAALLGRLPDLEVLRLDAMPAAEVLDSLTASTVPRLRMLQMNNGCGPMACRLPALRRLLARVDTLHVRFQRDGLAPACQTAHGAMPRGVILLPHKLSDYCRDCPARPVNGKKASAVSLQCWM